MVIGLFAIILHRRSHDGQSDVAAASTHIHLLFLSACIYLYACVITLCICRVHTWLMHVCMRMYGHVCTHTNICMRGWTQRCIHAYSLACLNTHHMSQHVHVQAQAHLHSVMYISLSTTCMYRYTPIYLNNLCIPKLTSTPAVQWIHVHAYIYTSFSVLTTCMHEWRTYMSNSQVLCITYTSQTVEPSRTTLYMSACMHIQLICGHVHWPYEEPL